MYSQINDYFETILVPSQYGFRKEFSAENCLLAMTNLRKVSIERMSLVLPI